MGAAVGVARVKKDVGRREQSENRCCLARMRVAAYVGLLAAWGVVRWWLRGVQRDSLGRKTWDGNDV